MIGPLLGERSRDLDQAEIRATAESIAAVQLANGMIPWVPGGHGDPWNHVEAAMALAVGGLVAAAELAYQWLADGQHGDGSWCSYYLSAGVEQPRRDTNMCAYVAVGVWYHYLTTADRGFLDRMWPSVDRAVRFVLAHQEPDGTVAWAVEPDGSKGRFALLAGSSSIHLSLRCALAAARHLGLERPDWELAIGRLAHAVASHPERFEPKRRWAMDWYYPVLTGAVLGQAGVARMEKGWGEFVIEGAGVRCVSDRPWITAAETAECAMAFDSAGLDGQATSLLGWVHELRHADGSYWTGRVHPDGSHFPGGERSTYSAAAVLLAVDALGGLGPASGLFRGVGLPAGVDLPEVGPAYCPGPTRRSTRRLPQAESSTKAPELSAARHSP